MHYFFTGFEKEGKLQSKLVPILYKYISNTSLNPIKVSLWLVAIINHMILVKVKNLQSLNKA